MGFENLSPAEIEELNDAYLPRRTVANAEQYLSDAAQRSAEIRATLTRHLDIAYGDTSFQTLDIFPAALQTAPVFVFIHGGYWWALDKSFYSDIAPSFVSAGATVVLLNYDLCPIVTIPEITRQIKQAVKWVHENIGDYNGDRDKLHLCGHSAGGHLAGMMMTTDWQAEFGLPGNLLKSATPLSGLFDIEPHRHTELQAHIQLTAADAKANSPQNLPLYSTCPVLCAVGGGESGAFKKQSLDFADKCRQAGIGVEYLETGTDNHFDITNRLQDPDDPMTRAILGQMGL